VVVVPPVVPEVVPPVVPVVEPEVLPVEAAHAFNLARVAAPTKPVPLERPTGVKTSEAYKFWNLITAALVAGPK
jgi:hypothetical protein